MFARLLIMTILIIAPWIAGCTSNSTVRGIITYEGQVVEAGFITFFPVGNANSTQGAEIVQGKYEIMQFSPGNKRVLISAKPHMQIENNPGVKAVVKVLPPPVYIAPTAIGNNQIIMIGSEQRQLDFQLHKAR